MKITQELVDTASAHFLSIDEMAYIWDIYFEEKWNISLSQASLSKMERMKILDKKGKLTPGGESIILLLVDEPERRENKSLDEEFELFWKLYPRDDSTSKYSKTRQLRWNKGGTKKEFFTLCENYGVEAVINALKKEIAFRTSPSEENLLKYMCNSVNWFKKEAYATFIDDEEDEITTNEYGKEIS